MKQVLIICTGNICRSPLAEALLRRALEERGIDEIAVSSAGTGAWDGASASPGALLVGLEHDMDLSTHSARLLTRELAKQADLILTMTRHHRARVEELGGERRVFVLGEYAGLSGPAAEVSDPFGAELEVYRETYDELADLMKVIVERLEQTLCDKRQRD